MRVRTIKASEFKAKCLALMDGVQRTGEPVLVTKHGSPLTPSELRADLLAGGVQEIPLTGDAAIAAAGFGLHHDPADRFIAAAAWVGDATLVTADERLLAWEHPLRRHDARR